MSRAQHHRVVLVAVIFEGLAAVAAVGAGPSAVGAVGHHAGQDRDRRAALAATVAPPAKEEVLQHGPEDISFMTSQIIDAKGQAHSPEADIPKLERSSGTRSTNSRQPETDVVVHQVPLVRAEEPRWRAPFSHLAASLSQGATRDAKEAKPSVAYWVWHSIALLFVMTVLVPFAVAGAGNHCCPNRWSHLQRGARRTTAAGEPQPVRLSWEERASRFSRVERGPT